MGEMEEGERQAGGPDTAAGASRPASDAATHAEPDPELASLARALFKEGVRMMRLKPMPHMRDSVRGLPEVMRLLCRSDRPMSPGELARTSGVTDARIANILKVLESRGLIERRPDERDRRRVVVSVTGYGRAQEKARAQVGMRFMTGFLAELGLDDARELVRIVGRVNEVIERRREEGREMYPSDPAAGSADVAQTPFCGNGRTARAARDTRRGGERA